MVDIWHRLDGLKPEPTRRGAIARRHTALADASPYDIELKTLLACRAIIAEWHDLVRRTIEPNVFANPEMMLPAALHLPAAHPPAAIIVRDAQRRLVGLFPLVSGRMPLLPGAVHAYTTPYHPVGVPLLDRLQAPAVLSAALNWLDAHSHALPGFGPGATGVAGMLWPDIPQDGLFARALRDSARRDGRDITLFDLRQRPVLRPAADAQARLPQTLPARRRKDIERLRRRLAERGQVRFEEAAAGQPLRDAVESFMVLEASGWKGARGAALVQNARTAGFIRSVSRMLGRMGGFSVLTLFCGGESAAAALVLETGDRSWFYKIAYDPAFASFSPGLVLAAELSRRQQARSGIVETDSCADQPSRLLETLWHDTVPYADMLVATRPGATAGAVAMRARERLRRDLRKRAKAIYRRLKGYER